MGTVKQMAPDAATSKGQPETVEANGTTSIAEKNAIGKFGHSRALSAGFIAFRASTGAVWRYRGKRARVLAMLATMPACQRD